MVERTQVPILERCRVRSRCGRCRGCGQVTVLVAPRPSRLLVVDDGVVCLRGLEGLVGGAPSARLTAGAARLRRRSSRGTVGDLPAVSVVDLAGTCGAVGAGAFSFGVGLLAGRDGTAGVRAVSARASNGVVSRPSMAASHQRQRLQGARRHPVPSRRPIALHPLRNQIAKP
jgi:hypothetical protein